MYDREKRQDGEKDQDQVREQALDLTAQPVDTGGFVGWMGWGCALLVIGITSQLVGLDTPLP